MEEILKEIRALRNELRQFRDLIIPLAIRQRSRSQQARKLGVSRSTLWRRERKARARAALL